MNWNNLSSIVTTQSECEWACRFLHCIVEAGHLRDEAEAKRLQLVGWTDELLREEVQTSWWWKGSFNREILITRIRGWVSETTSRGSPRICKLLI